MIAPRAASEGIKGLDRCPRDLQVPAPPTVAAVAAVAGEAGAGVGNEKYAMAGQHQRAWDGPRNKVVVHAREEEHVQDNLSYRL